MAFCTLTLHTPHSKLFDRAFFPADEAYEAAVSHLAAERERGYRHALPGDLVDVAAGIFDRYAAILHELAVAVLIVRELDGGVFAGRVAVDLV